MRNTFIDCGANDTQEKIVSSTGFTAFILKLSPDGFLISLCKEHAIIDIAMTYRVKTSMEMRKSQELKLNLLEKQAGFRKKQREQEDKIINDIKKMKFKSKPL